MSATAAAVPAPASEPLSAVPAKPEHKVGQLTTAELARERSRLEAALGRPFTASVLALLQHRLVAALDEQAERKRRREADVAAAKAARADRDADQAARTARTADG